jgi:hypothetical protein
MGEKTGEGLECMVSALIHRSDYNLRFCGMSNRKGPQGFAVHLQKQR